MDIVSFNNIFKSRNLLVLLISFCVFFSNHSFAKEKFYACAELKNSISYPKVEDILIRKGRVIAVKYTVTGLKEIVKFLAPVALGATAGLPISVSVALLFKGLQMAGVDFDKNKRQMIAVITVSEALLNKEIDIETNFDKHDLVIFEDFISARDEFNKFVKRQNKKRKVKTLDKALNNIQFAQLIKELELFDGDIVNPSSIESIKTHEFYCRKKRNGKVNFRGFNRKAKEVMYSYLLYRRPSQNK